MPQLSSWIIEPIHTKNEKVSTQNNVYLILLFNNKIKRFIKNSQDEVSNCLGKILVSLATTTTTIISPTHTYNLNYTCHT